MSSEDDYSRNVDENMHNADTCDDPSRTDTFEDPSNESSGPPASHVNIMDNVKASKQSKFKSALNHFNGFLQEYWIKLGKGNVDGVSNPSRLYDELVADDLGLELFGCYANYLAQSAENLTQQKRGISTPLSWNSAVGYFSAIKTYFKEHVEFRNQAIPHVFCASRWSDLSTKLTGAIVERHKETGTPMVNPKAAATTDDWKALACICAWMGSEVMLEFWCIFVALTHFAARVNEPAFLRFEHCDTAEVQGQHNTVNIVGHYHVANYKQSNDQNMHVFPHIDLWQLDFFFSQSVYFACSTATDSEFVFPTYGMEAQKQGSGTSAKNSTKIVTLFTKALNACKTWFEQYQNCMDELEERFQQHIPPGELSEGICSHSGKKYAVRNMSRELNPVYVIFRAGWEVRNTHTLFDYLVKDVVHDIKAAKICAGWNTKWHEQIWGGFNNQLDDLSQDKDKFLPFCRSLFQFPDVPDGEPRRKRHMRTKNILLHGFSVLRFYEDFRACMEANPLRHANHEASTIYDSNEIDPFFVRRVRAARIKNSVSDDLFSTWQKDVKDSFLQRNCFAMSLQDTTMVDSRPLLQTINQLCAVVGATAETCNKTFEKCKNLENTNKMLYARVDRLETMIVRGLRRGILCPHVPGMPPLLLNDDNDIDQNDIDQDDNAVPTPLEEDNYRTKEQYDLLMHNLHGQKPIPIPKLFTNWFLDQLPITYENYKSRRNKSTSKEDKKNHKRIKDHFSITKTAIHVVLVNMDAYPTASTDFEAVANEALQRIMNEHNLKKLPSRSKLNEKYIKSSSLQRNFPEGTPLDIQKWFKSRGLENKNFSQDDE